MKILPLISALLLFFIQPIFSQTITLKGRLEFSHDRKAKTGVATLLFSDGQSVQTNKKGVFQRQFPTDAQGKLLEITEVQLKSGKAVEIVEHRSMEYILLEPTIQEHPLTVYIMDKADWDAQKKQIELTMSNHDRAVLSRLAASIRKMDGRKARNMAEMLQSAYPQYKSLLASNLQSNVTTRLSPVGQKAFLMLVETDDKVSEAIQTLETELQNNTKPYLADLWLLAQLKVLDFKFEEAAALYLHLLSADPTNLGLLIEFKEMAIMSNHSELVAEALTDALNRVKDDHFQAINHNDLASIYHLHSDYDKTISETNIALSYMYKLERDNPDRFRLTTTAVLFNLANVYRETKTNDAQALATFDTVIARIALEPDSKNNDQLGSIHFLANNFAGIIAAKKSTKEAYPYFQKAINAYLKNPSIAAGYPRDEIFKSFLHYCEGKEANNADGKEVTGCYEQAAELLDDAFINTEQQSLGRTIAFYKIAKYQESQGETQGALRFYLRAIDALESPETPKTLGLACNLLNCTGAMLGDYGRDDEAKAYFARAIEKAKALSPTDADESNRNLGQVWFNIGQFYKNRMMSDSAFAAFSSSIGALSAIKSPKESDKSLIANNYNQTGALWAEHRNDPAHAESDFLKAVELFGNLADQNPAKYTMDVVICTNNLLNTWSDHLETADKKAALNLIEQARKRLKTRGLNPDEVNVYGENMATYQKIFSGQMGPFELALVSIGPLQNRLKSIKGEAGKSALAQQIVVKLEQALAASPADKKERLQLLLSQESGNLSWHALFDRQYALSESSARRALELDPTQVWINSNLAHALVLQGKITEGKAIYMKYKEIKHTDNRPFRVIFLEDILALQKAGIDPPGFKEVIEMLK